jgi:hypothetical protein
VHAADAVHPEIGVQHVVVMPGRVSPTFEHGHCGRIAGGDVLALVGVVAVTKVTHAGPWALPERVGVAEVPLDAHVVAHPFGGGLDVVVYEKGRLFWTR